MICFDCGRCLAREAEMPVHIARRLLVVLIASVLAAWSAGAEAQQTSGKIPRVGVLWHGANEEEEAVYLDALRQGLRDFGYIEGHNIKLENRFPAEEPERFSSLAIELAELKVDVLVAINRHAALAAQRASKTIPIVFVAVPNVVRIKLVSSMARPGANLTGLSNMALDLTAKRLELLKLAVCRNAARYTASSSSLAPCQSTPIRGTLALACWAWTRGNHAARTIAISTT